jgi:ATP-dependent DNA helicase RecG
MARLSPDSLRAWFTRGWSLLRRPRSFRVTLVLLLLPLVLGSGALRSLIFADHAKRLISRANEQLLAALPFQLTGAQRRVVEEIARDLAREVPMHRLLQGDVGSGKTVVAALAAAVAIEAGWQCALMAPTEILAEQHFRKLIGWLEPILAPRGLRVAWLTGSQKKKERGQMLEVIASGEAALVVGTHAVIQEQVQFRRLGLAVIDEQHRFGVAQRLALRSKLQIQEGGASLEPHMLMMSATPIPRTLAMSYYADLDVSTIDELPPGRTPIVTKVVADSRRAQQQRNRKAALTRGAARRMMCARARVSIGGERRVGPVAAPCDACGTKSIRRGPARHSAPARAQGARGDRQLQ